MYSGKGKHKVLIRFSERVAEYIREKKWHPSQKLRVLKNGELELQMTLSSMVEVQRWILQWGGDARVTAPKELKNSIRTAAQSILKQQRTKGSARR